MKPVLLALALSLPALVFAQPREALYSPGRNVVVNFALRDGVPTYSITSGGAITVDPSALALDLDPPFEARFRLAKVARATHRSSWRPIYGEREQVPDNFNALSVDLVENGARGRSLRLEFRAYDEGVAFRYVFPEANPSSPVRIKQELSEFRLATGAEAFPIYNTEQTFSTSPSPIADVKPGALTPLTAKVPGGFASILEAYVVNYPRMRLNKTSDGALVSRLLGPVVATPPFSSPWRLILLGKDEGRLIENEYLVVNLNPPSTIGDTGWIRPGKTISNEGSMPLKTAELKKLVDFASANSFRYLQLDWGWYGTEFAWTDEERGTFRKTMPELATNPEWVANSMANPLAVAKGLVPYRPNRRASTQVDLDLPELIRYAKDHGMGVCLYVEASRMLRAHDMDKLFATYHEWGVAGLKPGFVRYGSQENTEWIRNMVATAAKHKLWLCVHDAHVPDGMERTFPNLMMVEGGGGQEGNHPVAHDLMLPFTRCLAGAFDYTPAIFTRGRSHAHVMGFLVAYYGPAQTIRRGYRPWNGASGAEKGGAELEFLSRVPVTWDETRVLSARIGRQLVVARRSGTTWYVGGLAGDEPISLDVPLEFLERGQTYSARIFRDDPSSASDGWLPARLEARQVRSADALTIRMEKAGGFAAILEPSRKAQE